MARQKFTKLEEQIWDLVNHSGVTPGEMLNTLSTILELMREA